MQKLPVICLVLVALCLGKYARRFTKEKTLLQTNKALLSFQKPLQAISKGHLPESTRDVWDTGLSPTDVAYKDLLVTSENIINHHPRHDGRSEWMQYVKWMTDTVGLPLDAGYRDIVKGWNKFLKSKKPKIKENKLKMQQKKRNNVITDYQHSFTPTISRGENNTDKLRVVIQELYNNKLTQGGANFRVNVTSFSTSLVCPVHDYLNGTYLVECVVDLTYVLDSYTIDVHLQFVNFNAYKLYVAKSNHIWTYNVEMTAAHRQQMAQVVRYRECTGRVKDLDYLTGYWVKNDTESHYNRYILSDNSAPGGHCQYPLIGDEKIVKCFKEHYKSTITAVGDSHMRYSFYQIVRKTGGPQLYKKIGKDVNVKKWHFKWANYCQVLKGRLVGYIMERDQDSSSSEGASSHQHLLLFEGGHWDIRVNTIQMLMECFVTSIVPLLQRIQELPNTTIIWQDNPPLPDTAPLEESNPAWVGKRNRFVVMVVNHFISTHLRHLGIPVVPLRAITTDIWGFLLYHSELSRCPGQSNSIELICTPRTTHWGESSLILQGSSLATCSCTRHVMSFY